MNTEEIHRLSTRIGELEQKIDVLIESQKDKIAHLDKRYLSSREVARLTGLDQRTILNRSNLSDGDPRFIPSLSFGSSRKYFERKVIERIFKLR